MIRYAVDSESGLTYSMVGSQLAVPFRDKKNKFGEYDYKLEKLTVSQLGKTEWEGLRWTRQLPKSLKNYHRQFWGLNPL